jgi:hypothetical protein
MLYSGMRLTSGAFFRARGVPLAGETGFLGLWMGDYSLEDFYYEKT